MKNTNQENELAQKSLKSMLNNSPKRIKFKELIFALLIHLELLLIAFYVITEKAKISNQDIVVTTEMSLNEYEPIDLNKKRAVIKMKSDNEIIESEPAVVTEDIFDPRQTPNEKETLHAEGESDAISNVPLIGTNIMGSIGGDKGMNGAFSLRNGSGKKKAIFRGGGSKQTESAVDAALNWLMRHQEKDGHWNRNKFGSSENRYGFDRNKIDANITLTGLATLAFLSAGNSPKVGKYKDNVNKAINWILSKQLSDGSFGYSLEFSVYQNAICAIVLAELAGMCPDQKYKIAAQRTINYLVNLKKVHRGFSIHSGIPNSTSVNGWLLMAFKSAKLAGLYLPPIVFDKMHKRLVEVTVKDQSGNFESVHYIHKNDRQDNNTTMTAVGMLMYEYLGVDRLELKNLADKLIKDLPVYGEINLNQEMYHWYNATLALYQFGGEHWRAWNSAMSNMLVSLQRTDGPIDGSTSDLNGSWDSEKDIWGFSLGRIYTTAMGALCLEVYYRYDLIYKDK